MKKHEFRNDVRGVCKDRDVRDDVGVKDTKLCDVRNGGRPYT